MTLCSNNMFAYSNKIAKGTKMPVVSASDLLNYKVPYNEKIIKLFNSIQVKDIMISNVQQNIIFEKLRDFLLPLLMNGQAIIE